MSTEIVPQFLPRSYQQEIFEQARDGNIICAMETGSGKTFIAVLLVKWLAAQTQNVGKKIIFLVPKVPLVEQQAAVFKQHTPLRIRGYYGELGVDTWDRNVWLNEFNMHDVLVMTAQIFYDVVLHAHWSIANCAMLIFDEAHHCQKKHVYAKIMTDHYHRCPAEERPKILGLTASPVWNPKDPQLSIWKLEQAMCAKVIAVRANTEELASHSPKPIERIEEYPPPPLFWDAYPSPTLWSECEAFLRATTSFEDHSRRIGKYHNVLEATGPWGADKWILFELESLVAKMKTGIEAALSELARRKSGMSSVASTQPENLRRIYEIIERHRLQFAEDIVIDPAWLSPKITLLIKVLESANSRTENFHGIVFTQQRGVAASIAWVLSRVPSLKTWLRCGFVMGHGATNARVAEKSSDGMRTILQHEMIAKFRTSELNLLIATNVAEEGLDFKACNIIVRYDALQTFVGYVQSRGRARRANSDYVIFIPQGVSAQRDVYEQYKAAEPGLKRRYQSNLDEALQLAQGDDGDEDLDETSDGEIHEIPSTGAILTAYASIPLLVFLCTLVPRDAFSPMIQPKWELKAEGEGHYACTVTLPNALPLPSSQRIFYGPIRRGKRSAKSSAAYKVMLRLLELDVFDSYLLPGRLQRGDNALDADGRTTISVSDLTSVITVDSFDAFGNVWDDSATISWLHPIFLDGFGALALVTAEKLSPFSSDFLSFGGVTKRVTLGESIQYAWPDVRTQLNGLNLLDAYFRLCCRMAIPGAPPNQHDSPYLVAPLEKSGDINWSLLQETLMHPDLSIPLASKTSMKQLVRLTSEVGRTYELVRVRDDVMLNSVPEVGSREEDYDTYEEYWSVKHQYDVPGPVNQPMVELRLLRKHQVFSSTLSRISNIPSLNATDILYEESINLFPLALCVPIRTPFAVYDTLRTLPSILRHVSDLHRVALTQERIGLPKIDPDRLLEATTVPSSGAHYSFQRLETLGDAVLKICTATHIFNKFPHRHEGQLDIVRSNSINNTYLLGRAREVGLQSYLIHEQLKPRWRPTTKLAFLDGEWMTTENLISRKCLPDVMEALLGAAYLKGGIDCSLQGAEALGLCCGGPIPWRDRNYDIGAASDVAQGQIALLQPLEERLGYKFRNWKLLLEALCHPTFRSNVSSSYQRLEFLGDEVIDMYVTQYLFLKYPLATPGQITWAKSRSVCNPVLGTLSAKALSLQKHMLADSPSLVHAIDEYIQLAESVPYSELVVKTWSYDPPKPLADLFEAVIGAVFVDSNFDIDTTCEILAPIMKDVTDVVSPNMPRDPTTELHMWAARHGCTAIKYLKSASKLEQERLDSMSVLIHGADVTSPMKGDTLSLSKYMASTRALQAIQDPTSPFELSKICTCEQRRAAELAAKEAKEAALKVFSGSALPAPEEHPVDKKKSVSRSLAAELEQSEAALELERVALASVLKLGGEKGGGDGDALDLTENGFAARARAADELFSDGWGDEVGTPWDDDDDDDNILDSNRDASVSGDASNMDTAW